MTETTKASPDAPASTGRAVRKLVTGRVVSSKMDKTITVSVERRVPHPLYGKIVRKQTKLYAHDEENVAGEGDIVELMGTRPLSKLKRWRLVRVVRKHN